MKAPLIFSCFSRLSCLAVILIMGLGLVGCSDDDTTPVGPPPEPPANPVGAIQIYSDSGGSSCSIAGNPTGFETVYLFHTGHQGVTGSQFRIETGSTGFAWIADQLQGRTLSIGSTNVGASFAYGFCISGDYNFAAVTYQCNGNAMPCSQLEVVAQSIEGVINAVSCGDVKSAASGSVLTVNCANPGTCTPLTSSQSTWDRVQALND